MTDQTLVNELRRRIADPGAILPRIPDTAVNPGETVGNWAARAVAAGLEDGTLGYVPAADLADAAQAHAIIDATRQMANDANAKLRTQLLAALGREDDGRTPLSGYISHLVAQRDALKAALAKDIGEVTALVPGSSRRAQEELPDEDLVDRVAQAMRDANTPAAWARVAPPAPGAGPSVPFEAYARAAVAELSGSSQRAQERWPDAEETARLWHNTCEKLMHPESRVPWRDMPEQYRKAMITTAEKQLDWLRQRLDVTAGESQASEPDPYAAVAEIARLAGPLLDRLQAIADEINARITRAGFGVAPVDDGFLRHDGCTHIVAAHTENGCCYIGCRCKAKASALRLAPKLAQGGIIRHDQAVIVDERPIDLDDRTTAPEQSVNPFACNRLGCFCGGRHD